METTRWYDKYKGADYGQAAGLSIQDVMSTLFKLAKSAVNATPPATTATGLGAISGTPTSQGGVGANINEALVKSLSPYQQGVEKGLKKTGEQQATEALAAGVPPEHIAQQAGIAQQQSTAATPQGSPAASPQPGMAQPQAPMTPQAPQGMPTQQGPGNPLTGFLNWLSSNGSFDPKTGQMTMPSSFGGFIQPSASAQANLTQAAMGQQKMRGMEPMQVGEREKQGYETARELIKEKGNLGSKIFDMEDKLGTKFDKSIEDYSKILPRYDQLRKLIIDPDKQFQNGMSDLMVINEALKIIDPASVNREGEVKNMSQAEGRLRGVMKSASGGFITGRKLSEKGRQELLKAMTAKYQGYVKLAKQSYDTHAKQIESYGGDPKRALRFPMLQEEGKGGAAATADGAIDLGGGFTMRKVSS